jgi:hypothetical protein
MHNTANNNDSYFHNEFIKGDGVNSPLFDLIIYEFGIFSVIYIFII